jgi:uncharacterized protein
MNRKNSLQFNKLTLKDKRKIQSIIDQYQPVSCEYNFSNLFTWQHVSRLSFTIYEKRLLIYDDLEKKIFMPLGKEFTLQELAVLSHDLKNRNLPPDFCLATSEYIKKFSEIENYYSIKKERNHAEYIYDINKLCDLKGKKLHKKRNLIAQFKKNYPCYKIESLKKEYKKKALALACQLMDRHEKPLKTLGQEYGALISAFDHFDELEIEGVAIIVKNKLVAFSIFSRLNTLTYDIQFEKTDMDFKGVSQTINHETAKYLKSRCKYLNREQDLGIIGLRRAKKSYEPSELIIPYTLTFAPVSQ